MMVDPLKPATAQTHRCALALRPRSACGRGCRSCCCPDARRLPPQKHPSSPAADLHNDAGAPESSASPMATAVRSRVATDVLRTAFPPQRRSSNRQGMRPPRSRAWGRPTSAKSSPTGQHTARDQARLDRPPHTEHWNQLSLWKPGSVHSSARSSSIRRATVPPSAGRPLPIPTKPSIPTGALRGRSPARSAGSR